MRLDRSTICNTPFLNIYSYCTEKICIVPIAIQPKEERKIEDTLNVKVVKASINHSPLVGVYLCGAGERVIAEKNSIYPEEIELLEKEGLKVKLLVSQNNAFGNLVAMNSNYAIASQLLPEEAIKSIKSFFNIQIEQRQCIGLDLPGSSIYVNEHLFLVNPRVEPREFNYLKKMFKAPGVAITANYGDLFVGNDAIGNSQGLLVGHTTSNIEMTKIDDLIVDIK